MATRLQAVEAILPTLATKVDFADLRAEFAELRGEMRTGFAELRREMAEHRVDTHRWMMATVIGLFIGFGGLFLAMSNALKPSAPVVLPAQQPIIINVPAAPAPEAPRR